VASILLAEGTADFAASFACWINSLLSPMVSFCCALVVVDLTEELPTLTLAEGLVVILACILVHVLDAESLGLHLAPVTMKLELRN